LTEGTDQTLYGTTYGGGFNGSGTVFKLDHDGSGYTVVHNFTGTWEDGANPFVGVTEGSDGTLYGTAQYGGTNGYGTVFKLNKDGSGYQVLYSFTGFDGNGISGPGIVQGSDGMLYRTALGGTTGELTVFKLNVDGSDYKVLQSFQSVWAGDYAGRVSVTRDGVLYEFTTVGRAGVIFRVNTDGSAYELLHTFTGAGDGYRPNPGLFQGSDGAFYGTTSSGGDLGFGTVFKLFSSTPVISFERIESSGAGARLSLSGGAAA
jgi:uncharacterized repeat protein (TIGR03803 family)